MYRGSCSSDMMNSRLRRREISIFDDSIVGVVLELKVKRRWGPLPEDLQETHRGCQADPVAGSNVFGRVQFKAVQDRDAREHSTLD